MVLLDEQQIKSMAPGRFFRDHTGPINSLDFHHTEDVMVTVGDDDALHLYRTNTGQLLKTLYSKKYGCSCVTFTHASQAVVYASKVKTASAQPQKDHALRYHSLHDNTYLRYFVGHADQVVSVAMSAKTDQFLSAAKDRTVRLWDLRTNVCNGVIRCATTPSVACDAQGLIFAAATDDGEVKLYDARGYDQGPFTTFRVGAKDRVTGHAPRVTCAKFSPDGEFLLCVAGGVMYVLNAFEGDETMRINVGAETGGMGQGKDAAGASGNNLEACWTPDGQYVLSGGADSRVHVWSAKTGGKVAVWGSRHAGIPSSIRWAPGMMLAASACTEGGCALWIPQNMGA
ncbi:COMPASS/Set1C complex protein [Micromonas pusilla CCMP1545]|uniref:COMPASS/Set1C complex protein n=1 Tax=Micromonas pusilla (strain CCMP1545) TaxID=564608 RepID=C1MIQ8_MICPC|nr:COMPASS/Set1C complex protein [Micromonas pusilla CCMP1545]EEH60425.1 COMPASS/Set1C complex protein [Micromonas pusilla CCMP1545]|eukprot:XP_003055173.1 COMPASS/Set1C complex protein [Micromonas pusilla CCMP1545]